MIRQFTCLSLAVIILKETSSLIVAEDLEIVCGHFRSELASLLERVCDDPAELLS